MSLEENKVFLRRVIDEVLNHKMIGAIDEFSSPDYVDHALMPGQDLDRDEFKQFAAILFDAFPDFHVTVEDMLAEKEKVM